MPRADNPFLTYLNSHPGSDAVALKQLFRMLAKRTHPDLGAENEADFVARDRTQARLPGPISGSRQRPESACFTFFTATRRTFRR